MASTTTIDASNRSLGRVASAAAKALLDKHSPAMVKHLTADVEVKIVNASKVRISGNKERAKKYVRYSGYPGGKKEEPYDMLVSRRGHAEAIRRAVKGMLPKNKLQGERLKHLTIEN